MSLKKCIAREKKCNAAVDSLPKSDGFLRRVVQFKYMCRILWAIFLPDENLVRDLLSSFAVSLAMMINNAIKEIKTRGKKIK